jgi:hypothetical protein
LDFSFKDDVTVVLLLGVSYMYNRPYVFIGQRRVCGDWRATTIWKGDVQSSISNVCAVFKTKKDI